MVTSSQQNLSVRVTQEHIKAGRQRDSFNCPIARAIGHDAVVRKKDVLVKGFLYKLPDEAMDFIKKFDEGHDVEPAEFELRKQT